MFGTGIWQVWDWNLAGLGLESSGLGTGIWWVWDWNLVGLGLESGTGIVAHLGCKE